MKTKYLWSCVLILSLILLHSSIEIAAQGGNPVDKPPDGDIIDSTNTLITTVIPDNKGTTVIPDNKGTTVSSEKETTVIPDNKGTTVSSEKETTDIPDNEGPTDTAEPEEDKTEVTESKLHGIEKEIFDLLLHNSDTEMTHNIKELQRMLNGLNFGLGGITEMQKEEEVETTTKQTTTTATTKTDNTTTPAHTTATTNTTTQPTNVSSKDRIETTKDELTIVVETSKSPSKTNPSQKHFYTSSLFFFLLFCSLMAIFSLYFLYISRRKLKAYFYKNFASGRGNKGAYARAPTLEDAMPSFAEVKI